MAGAFNKSVKKRWSKKLRELQQARAAPQAITNSQSWQSRLQTMRANPSAVSAPPRSAQEFSDPTPPLVVCDARRLVGVNLHAPWALFGVGICAAWRRLARALADTVPVHLTLDPFYGPTPHAAAAAEVARLLTPTEVNAFVGGFPTAGDTEQARIIHALVSRPLPVALTTMVERDRIGPLSVAAANRVKQWWLPCESNIRAFRRSGVDDYRLHKVHIPFFPNDPHLGLVGRQRSPGPIHFYRIGVIDARKDQKKTVLAFLRAFKPGEAILTLKTTAAAYALSEIWPHDERVRGNGWTEASMAAAVRIINHTWSETDLLELHRQGDVYLSLSHGEGWDMPAFDALLSGNRLVYSESGGPEEFASEGDLRVPTTAMVPCDPVYRWEPDARWADFDVDAAVLAMQRARHEPLPKEHRRSWSGFTSTDVGALMKNLLEDLIAPSIALVAPRHPRGRLRKQTLAILSLFRQCDAIVPRYRQQIESLCWPERPHVVCVEGDSTDATPERLDAWARETDRVHVIHHSLGNPLFGSVLHPLRLLTLATVSNVGLDYITEHLDVEYVLFLTSDLICEPTLALRLRDVLERQPRAGLVAPMIWRGDTFYDTWAFRGNARSVDPRFSHGPSKAELKTKLGVSPVELQSVGSVLFCRSSAIYAGVRFTPDKDVVGFSTRMREAGYRVFADPTTDVHHPPEIHTEVVRAQPNPQRMHAAATGLLHRWLGHAQKSEIAELASTYTYSELESADGPVSVDQAIASGRTEVIGVYQPNSVPHGVASHAMFLRDAHPKSAWVRSLDEVVAIADRADVKAAILQIQWGCQPTHEELTRSQAAMLDSLRSRAVRVIVNYHHAESSSEWLTNLAAYRDHSDLIVFHHPSAVDLAGTGIYCPLPVPQLRIHDKEKLGGLAFMGFADPSRRIDLLVGVAERLAEPIYGYGPRLRLIPSWHDTRGWRWFRPVRSYLSEHQLATELARHSVALLARTPSSRAYSSASARFCMAAGLAVVVDHSKSYEDLARVVGAVVNYENADATDRVVKALLVDDALRSEVLERQRVYARKNSFAELHRVMMQGS